MVTCVSHCLESLEGSCLDNCKFIVQQIGVPICQHGDLVVRLPISHYSYRPTRFRFRCATTATPPEYAARRTPTTIRSCGNGLCAELCAKRERGSALLMVFNSNYFDFRQTRQHVAHSCSMRFHGSSPCQMLCLKKRMAPPVFVSPLPLKCEIPANPSNQLRVSTGSACAPCR